MRTLGGLVLLAGMGVGLFVYLPAPVDSDTSLDSAQRLAATVTARKPPITRAIAVPGQRSFSPRISLSSLPRGNVPSGMRASRSGGWRTTTAAISSDPQYKTLEPTSPESRYRLVVDLQEQLKRVGCYYGRIDGSWGPGSKYAMQSFMERVNAALPSDKPDYVSLSLLKAQSGKVCGACPADQLISPSGRCMPHTTIAYGHRGDDVTGQTASPREVLPWQSTANAAEPAVKPLFTPLPTSVVSTEPLPGRMSIGGPKTLPPVNSVYAAPGTPAGNGQSSTTTAAAIVPDAERARVTSAPAARRPPKTYKKARRRDGPGTPRYNLMLSLGGVY